MGRNPQRTYSHYIPFIVWALEFFFGELSLLVFERRKTSFKHVPIFNGCLDDEDDDDAGAGKV